MYESVQDQDFIIVSVAMDVDIEAARPWVEAASPTFVTLIDRQHLLSERYNMVNVPQAVWIDENGQVVRPTETGGSIDILQEFDMQARAFKPEAQARAQKAKTAYLDAVKDWAIHGKTSPHVMNPDQARTHVPQMTNDVAEAHVYFRLGLVLLKEGREEEAARWFNKSRNLHPDSWNIFRETSEKLENGIAGGEEFWQKVMSLGDKAYYEPIAMDGLPD